MLVKTILIIPEDDQGIYTTIPLQFSSVLSECSISTKPCLH